MAPYLFVLGRNAPLSRAELLRFGTEILFDHQAHLLLAEGFSFPARDDAAQAFLDRLGGTIRFGEVLGEYKDEKALLQAIAQAAHELKPEGKLHVGLSIFGKKEAFLRQLCPSLKDLVRSQYDRNLRTVNRPGQNLDSGIIFASKLLQKGFEFLIWHREGSFLLARTMANQNLDRYTLRDRGKPFRDTKMGMMIPKLAQIMINLGAIKEQEIVVDPFCGSGTVNIEAALMGHPTLGSDINAAFVQGAKKNLHFLADACGFDASQASFEVEDATKRKYAENHIIITEGFLGKNFERRPSVPQVRENAQNVLSMWEKVFDHLAEANVSRACFCLPSWRLGGSEISLAEKLFSSIAHHGYHPDSPFNGKKTFVYARPGAFVGREVCVVRKI